LAGISEGSVRNYVRAKAYKGYFSPGANPAVVGQPRQLSEADLALLAYIREQTAAGVPHDQIAAQLVAGGLDGFTWSAPGAAQEEAAGPVDGWGQPAAAAEPPPPAPLAIMAQSLVAELAAAREREAALWDRLIQAETRAARAEGELTAHKTAQAAPRGFFRRLFGG
jgi:hypothetical protein